MAKTLSESAAEILKASMSAGKEPMQKMSGEVNDLGGATTENPGGDGLGKAASSAVAEAPKPGSPGVPAEPMKKAPEQAEKIGDEEEALKKNPVDGGTVKVEETEVEGEVVAEDKGDVGTAGKPLLKPGEKIGKMDLELPEDEGNEQEAKKEMKEAWKKKAHKSMAEDVDALFNGESLSEEFKTKATTIFEAAVNARIDTIIDEMMTENDAVLAEAYESLQEEMATQVDEYLNYVVESWMEDNKVAIETGLRAELVDDFIGGLKNLFAEHYIEIPEEKVDVAEELAQRVATLEEEAAARDAEKLAIVEELNAAKKNEAIRKICEGLTETQIAKMKTLAEGVEFTTEGEFNSKLAVIRENYFPVGKVKSEVKTIQETTVSEEPEVAPVGGIMAHYVKAISKTAPKA
jgi:hypothetical protein